MLLLLLPCTYFHLFNVQKFHMFVVWIFFFFSFIYLFNSVEVFFLILLLLAGLSSSLHQYGFSFHNFVSDLNEHEHFGINAFIIISFGCSFLFVYLCIECSQCKFHRFLFLFFRLSTYFLYVVSFNHISN